MELPENSSSSTNMQENGFCSRNIFQDNTSHSEVPPSARRLERMLCMITDTYLPTLHEINLATDETNILSTEKWINIKGQVYPLPTIQPKVQLSDHISLDAVPRNVEIERRRRKYATLKIEKLLSQANVEQWRLIPVHVLSKLTTGAEESDQFSVQIPKLPLEWFDDYEYDCMLPTDWLDIGIIGGNKYPVPAKAFLPSPSLSDLSDRNQLFSWQHVSVIDYDAGHNKWLITVSKSGKVFSISRVYLGFLAEDPSNFVCRIKAALLAREEAEVQLKFNIIIDCMILTGVPIPNERTMQRIFDLVMTPNHLRETDRLPMISRLEDEMKREYQRTLGKLELLHNVLTSPAEYTFLRIPRKERGIRVKADAAIVRSTIGKEKFAEYKQRYRFITLYCLPEVIMAIEKVAFSCAQVSQMLMYTLSLSKTATLEDFYSVQNYTSTNVIAYLRGSWIEDVSRYICMYLRSIGKGWFDIDIDRWEIYRFSKLRRMMAVIKIRMEAALRFVIENSVNLYVRLLCDPCKCLLHLNNDFVWGPNLLEFPVRQTETHVFFLVLLMDETRAYYSTEPTEFKPIIVKLLDDAIRQTHYIHIIDAMTLIFLVFAENLFLSSVGLIEPVIETARKLLILSYEKALIPLLAYATQYDKHIEFYNMDVNVYLKPFKAMERTAQEFQQEIQYHFRMKENLQTTLPDTIQIGPFLINVLPLKEFMMRKRQELATQLIEFLTEKIRFETENIYEIYCGILKRLTDKVLSIEQIFDNLAWMETLPEIGLYFVYIFHKNNFMRPRVLEH